MTGNSKPKSRTNLPTSLPNVQQPLDVRLISTALSLLGLGALGAAAMLKRKQKNSALTPVVSQVVSKQSARAVVES